MMRRWPQSTGWRHGYGVKLTNIHLSMSSFNPMTVNRASSSNTFIHHCLLQRRIYHSKSRLLEIICPLKVHRSWQESNCTGKSFPFLLGICSMNCSEFDKSNISARFLPVNITGFKMMSAMSWVEFYYPVGRQTERLDDDSSDRLLVHLAALSHAFTWPCRVLVVIADSNGCQHGHFEQVSFVNSIWAIKVDKLGYISDHISKSALAVDFFFWHYSYYQHHLYSLILTKADTPAIFKPWHAKSCLFFHFCERSYLIRRPRHTDSQLCSVCHDLQMRWVLQQNMTPHTKSFGFKCAISAGLSTKVWNSEVSSWHLSVRTLSTRCQCLWSSFSPSYWFWCNHVSSDRRGKCRGTCSVGPRYHWSISSPRLFSARSLVNALCCWWTIPEYLSLILAR